MNALREPAHRRAERPWSVLRPNSVPWLQSINAWQVPGDLAGQEGRIRPISLLS